MSRRASRPGRRSEPTPGFIVERAYPETAREDAISLRDSPSDDPIVPGVSPATIRAAGARLPTRTISD